MEIVTESTLIPFEEVGPYDTYGLFRETLAEAIEHEFVFPITVELWIRGRLSLRFILANGKTEVVVDELTHEQPGDMISVKIIEEDGRFVATEGCVLSEKSN